MHQQGLPHQWSAVCPVWSAAFTLACCARRKLASWARLFKAAHCEEDRHTSKHGQKAGTHGWRGVCQRMT